eukprot:TRINITY_DN6852_c0_g1_i1.p1 TRINITY_DN6852_c0_g1~~TRINITY_DN6852_c0_g1_i1.p1  ORF type:complete len:322 (-),score=57.09 TRINITY_DN6852_c0_g1_i1:105-926(-)
MPIKDERRAAIAILLRVNTSSTTPVSPPTLNHFLQSSWVNEGTLEIFYIKRAINPKDRWSGHVAFPGGRCEPGESDLQTAQRETKEEIGIDLSNTERFAYLGRLRDRIASTRIRVAPLVFLKLDNEPLQFNLRPSEVSSGLWVPITYFESKNIVLKQKRVSIKNIWNNNLLHYLVPISEKLKIDAFYFPTVILPINEESMVLNKPSVLKKDMDWYELWGLTLMVTREVLETFGCDVWHWNARSFFDVLYQDWNLKRFALFSLLVISISVFVLV